MNQVLKKIKTANWIKSTTSQLRKLSNNLFLVIQS